MSNTNTIRNQYGEEFPTWKLLKCYDGNGIWIEENLNCYSSADLGLGTCRCVSHNTYLWNPASIEILKKNGIILTSEELFHQLLAIDGISREELENFCRVLYQIGSNPLPTIRKILTGISVNFMYQDENRNNHWIHEEGDNPEIVVELLKNYDGECTVWIEEYFW